MDPSEGATAAEGVGVPHGPSGGGADHLVARGAGGEGLSPGLDTGDGFGIRGRSPVDGTDPAFQGRYVIPWVVTRADWDWHRKALSRLMQDIRQSTNDSVQLTERRVDLGQDAIQNAPLLVFGGHHSFSLTAQQRRALREHVEHGGMIWADFAGDNQEFNDSFISEMSEIFGDDPKQLPMSSEIYDGGGVPIGAYGLHHPFAYIPAPYGRRVAVLITRNNYFDSLDNSSGASDDEHQAALTVGKNIFRYALRRYQTENAG